jgi:hypothetical protein
LKRKHFISILNLFFINTFVVLSQLKFQILERILILDKRIRCEGYIQIKWSLFHLINEIFIVLSRFLDDLGLRWWDIHLILLIKVALISIRLMNESLIEFLT